MQRTYIADEERTIGKSRLKLLEFTANSCRGCEHGFIGFPIHPQVPVEGAATEQLAKIFSCPCSGWPICPTGLKCSVHQNKFLESVSIIILEQPINFATWRHPCLHLMAKASATVPSLHIFFYAVLYCLFYFVVCRFCDFILQGIFFFIFFNRLYIIWMSLGFRLYIFVVLVTLFSHHLDFGIVIFGMYYKYFFLMQHYKYLNQPICFALMVRSFIKY